ncbi:MAG: hypothetical protein ACOCZ8_00430 [Bacteroidota bacterium]
MHLKLSLREHHCLKRKASRGDELCVIITDEPGTEPLVRRLPNNPKGWPLKDGDRGVFSFTYQ